MPGLQFSPARTVAISGDTVQWKNTMSLYVHNVKADEFTSPDLDGGETFARLFPSVAAIQYICQFHPGMSGRVDVYDAYLAASSAAVLFGKSVVLTGLAHAGESVTIERVGDGTPVATATADAEGRFSVSVTAAGPSFELRAVGTGAPSPTAKIEVRPRLTIAARKSGRSHRITIKAAPAQAGAAVVVERRGDFGWRRLARGTLGTGSSARLAIRVSGTARVRARVTRAVGGYAPGVSGTIRIRG
jgi:hypothetical protein